MYVMHSSGVLRIRVHQGEGVGERVEISLLWDRRIIRVNYPAFRDGVLPWTRELHAAMPKPQKVPIVAVG